MRSIKRLKFILKTVMENYSDEKENMPEEQKPLLPTSVSSKGGIKTLPLIIVALAANMIVYLMKAYHMDMASGTNFIYIWSALSNFAPVIGAFMADSFVGRFQMIGIGCVLSLVEFLVLRYRIRFLEDPMGLFKCDALQSKGGLWNRSRRDFAVCATYRVTTPCICISAWDDGHSPDVFITRMGSRYL
nr:protein NRT1/ PTR FAMILY 1.2-like [Ipomoea batatas]